MSVESSALLSSSLCLWCNGVSVGIPPLSPIFRCKYIPDQWTTEGSSSCSCRSAALHRQAIRCVCKCWSLWISFRLKIHAVWKLSAGLPSVFTVLCIYGLSGFYWRRGFIGAEESRFCSTLRRITSFLFLLMWWCRACIPTYACQSTVRDGMTVMLWRSGCQASWSLTL